MNHLNLSQPQLLLAAGALVLLLVVGGAIAWWRRRPRDPVEIERQRRARVNQVGRIVEGYVLEINEAAVESAPAPRRSFRFGGNGANGGAAARLAKKLVYYTYSISGVTYEAAQDLTDLEERACLARVVNGQHVSVKYDPANPSNSILVSDDWSGLH